MPRSAWSRILFQQHVVALLALAAADDLADARRQHVHGGDGLSVVVGAHVERLDLARVVGDDHRLLEQLLGQVALVLALQIDAPVDGELQVLAGLLQQARPLRCR